jgi:hypothetical protein
MSERRAVTVAGVIRRVFWDNPNFILASLAYVAAHMIDYLFTVPGIRHTVFREGNPIIQVYIDLFGLEIGLLSYKLLVCAAVIIGMKAVDLACEGKKARIRPEHILYGGAILTTLGGALWLYSPYV